MKKTGLVEPGGRGGCLEQSGSDERFGDNNLAGGVVVQRKKLHQL